jgi:uncharacterized iron-regulated membrane protein
MMTTGRIRTWSAIHKWTSLVCTAFLLLLCLTGLPLIFHHEIDHLLGKEVELPELPAGTPAASLDRVVTASQERHPAEAIRFVSWDPDDPARIFVNMGESATSPPEDARTLVVDARTAKVMDEPKFNEGFMYVMFKLHVDLFAGLPGTLFLGLMGLLFLAAIVSGVVLYAPFMRKLDFGTVRKRNAARVRWLDLHNLIGIVTLMWVFVVGATGVINTLADPLIKFWQFGQLAEMIAPYGDKAPLQGPGSLARAVATAREAVPGTTPAFVAFPGTPFSSAHHYAVFMRGETPLTSRLLKPALVEAHTGQLTATRDLPWYLTALLVSQPLHFGDYGGMPMKIIWALLDLLTIVVLGSGLYLWLAKLRLAPAERLREIQQAGDGRTA